MPPVLKLAGIAPDLGAVPNGVGGIAGGLFCVGSLLDGLVTDHIGFLGAGISGLMLGIWGFGGFMTLGGYTSRLKPEAARRGVVLASSWSIAGGGSP